ncbi:MAG: Acetyltransferase, including N-acetylases of ribosomal protein [uncultured Sulfurovum sp.]|uniref:Acetyltransferase, including N-acetylases of ribosomal protein n=1 Tax=uncultured Sulfurovum sp. TaxID=269237 RepID=A0A6S6SVK3_9BACT|nr:MAG: Acetyltransferase, including N-acetylases of ribosomal protein [uncultured Sulfurovum sp.]
MLYHFTTERLIAKEWHSFEEEELNQPDLVDIIENILVPDVTKTFPRMWQGNYNRQRAQGWIEDIDSEAKTVLAVDKETKNAIGFLNFYKVGNRRTATNFHVGYVVSREMWSQGFGTEFVEGFIDWCKKNEVSTVLAKVAPDNVASIRVLEKNNFLTERKDTDGVSHLFVYDCVE